MVKVKQLPNWLPIGVQSQFGPNLTMEFGVFLKKKLAWPRPQPPKIWAPLIMGPGSVIAPVDWE